MYTNDKNCLYKNVGGIIGMKGYSGVKSKETRFTDEKEKLNLPILACHIFITSMCPCMLI